LQKLEYMLSVLVESINSIMHVSRSPWSLCGFILGRFTLEAQQKGKGHSGMGYQHHL